ncbi:16S rRNA (adenine(1518)-N(6)/adenine(1519)-N(6))-dimethyltransferase RsmA [Chloroflexota bacterium]
MGKITLLSQTKRLLGKYRLSARKGLGQHFLIDETVLAKIVAAAAVTTTDTIIEVGPGLGVLTRELVALAGQVVAVELDNGAAALIEQEVGTSNNLQIIRQDIMEADIDSLSGGKSYKVVANLPYYIAAAVIRRFLEASHKPKSLVVMVQKEVAEIITAPPGKRSLLSIGVQYYAEPQIVCEVPAISFYPPPEVSSAVVKADIKTELPLPQTEEAGFFGIVRSGFTASRKQLANSLAIGLSKPKTETLALLEEAGVPPSQRAESLTLEEWLSLWQAYQNVEKGND